MPKLVPISGYRYATWRSRWGKALNAGASRFGLWRQDCTMVMLLVRVALIAMVLGRAKCCTTWFKKIGASAAWTPTNSDYLLRMAY
jgi:hypothetical protein